MTLRYNHPEVRSALTGKFATLANLLARPVDASALAAFRLLFGVLMVWEVGRYFENNYISQYYIEPRFHFTYEFFPFIAPLSGQGMYWLFGAMGLFALGIALGLYYRLATLLFWLTYTYVFLLDKTPYNNHYYLIILLSFLLFLVNAHHWASLDQWRATHSGPETVPFWQIFILRAQIFIVYFYGGIAKLNSDWLMGEPIRMWLAERTDYPLLGPFFASEWAVYFVSYGGLLFDLSIGFLLLWPPTRRLAFLGLLFFHLMNNWLFSIGIFPFLALAATILFVEPGWPRQVLDRVGKSISRLWSQVVNQHLPRAINVESRASSGLSQNESSSCQTKGWTPLYKVSQTPTTLKLSRPATLNAWTGCFILFYLALQFLIPLRHWLYPGDVSWTEEGHRFSWHMKLRDKDAHLEIKITDRHTGHTWNATLQKDLTDDQISIMASHPDMILQYAHYLQEKWQRTGLDNPIITANAWASLNGRPLQRLIDPTVNLAQVHPTPFTSAPWILPLEEKLIYPPKPVLHSLTLVVMLLANLGLALSIYRAIGYSGDVKTGLALKAHHSPEGAAAQTLTLSQIQISGLIKVTSSILPSLGILLSLAAWVISGQIMYLGVALAASLLAAGWGFYLASLPSLPFDRLYFRWGLVLLGILSGLFLLMLMIVAA